MIYIIANVNASAAGSASHSPGVPARRGRIMKVGMDNMKPRSRVNIVAERDASMLCL